MVHDLSLSSFTVISECPCLMLLSLNLFMSNRRKGRPTLSINRDWLIWSGQLMHGLGGFLLSVLWIIEVYTEKRVDYIVCRRECPGELKHGYSSKFTLHRAVTTVNKTIVTWNFCSSKDSTANHNDCILWYANFLAICRAKRKVLLFFLSSFLVLTTAWYTWKCHLGFWGL